MRTMESYDVIVTELAGRPSPNAGLSSVVLALYDRVPRLTFGLYDALKRVFDVTISLFLLIVLSPVLVFIAGVIVLDSPGPAIYTQWRKGRLQIPFRMYKFRTMRQNAHELRRGLAGQNEVDGIIFKIKSDSRITRVGTLLRRYSLDELPQLLNVLKGDMSLVGPRPFPLEDFESRRIQHRLYDRWLFVRHLIRPGLSGLWQVSGRTDLPFRKLIALDLKYVRRANPITDARILCQTIQAVLNKRGAY